MSSVRIRCRRCRRACRHLRRTAPKASGRGLRRREKGPQRSGRQTPGIDRPMSRRGRRGRCRRSHAQAGPRGGGSRRRPQRGGARDHRWRGDDRPGAHERHPRRPQEPYGAGAGWRHLGRAQPRDATARSGSHRRGGFQHGDRRAHPRRRTGLADEQVRPGPRQSSVRGARHRRRQGFAGSKDEEPDLFWALRGGGGNFGWRPSLEYQLHPVGPTVTGGPIAHPIRAVPATCSSSTATTRRSLPDEHTVFAITHACARRVGHKGGRAGHLSLRPAGGRRKSACGRSSSSGLPSMDAVGPMPYSQLNPMLDAAFPKGALNYWKSNFLAELSDAAIDTMIGCFARCPTPWASCCSSISTALSPGSASATRPFHTVRRVTTSGPVRNGCSQQRRTRASPGRARPMERWSPSSPLAAT